MITLYGAIQYDIKGKKSSKECICFVFLYIYLVLLIGLRYEVGGDTLNYMGDFELRKDLSEWSYEYDDNGFQPLYTLLCAIAKSISSEFYVFQIIHAIIFNGLLFCFIHRNVKYKYTALLLSFLIYYFYFSTEILRESLAVMVFLFNYKNLQESKWVRYYIGVGLSCLLHVSAIFLLLLPFLKWVRFERIYIVSLIIILFVMLQLHDIFSLFGNVSPLKGKISSYESTGFGGYLFSFINLMMYFVFPALICFLSRVLLKHPSKYENMLCIISLLGVASLFSFIVFSRFINYLLPFLAVAISEFFMETLKRKTLRQYAFLITCLSLFVYSANYIYLKRYTLWIPYHSIFNPVHVERSFYNYVFG